MMRSMTGFGQAQRSIGGAQYVVEIRSLNSRYFKATVRLPELWSAYEADIEKHLRERLRRGAVHLTMRMKTTSADMAHQVNTGVLERYVEQLDIVRPDQTDVAMSMDLASLLLLPGVCSPPELQEMVEGARTELMKLIDDAIKAVLAMRGEEGKAIAADLEGHCSVIEERGKHIAQRAPLVLKEYHQRLKRRVAELTGSAELALDQQELAREVAIYAERCDIAEELSRLQSHLGQFRSTMQAEDQPGRKLDFIAQEMLREANTIAAKGNDAEITREIVDVKSAVDRIKEQVQNVE